MKAVVIGNCQARPMAVLLERFAGVEIVGTFIIHLAKEEERAAHEAALDQADVVFSQLAPGTAWPDPVRSDYLKQAYPEKTVIWPNIYFRGQQPFLHYCRLPGQGLLSGPLADYQDLELLRAWFAERQGVSFAENVTEPGYTETIAETSLQALQQREQGCDVRVSDLVAETWRDRRLFFTFNHPSLWLLARLCERVLAEVGTPAQLDPGEMKESLGRIRPPSVLAPPEASEKAYLGVLVNLDTPGKIVTGPACPYTPDELRQTSFACYDHMAGVLSAETVQLSP